MTIRERPPKNTKNCNLDLSGAMADGYVLGRTNFFETFTIVSKKSGSKAALSFACSTYLGTRIFHVSASIFA